MSEPGVPAPTERELSVLSAVVETLLPGGDGFPPASSTSTPGLMVHVLGMHAVETWLRPGLASIEILGGGDFLMIDGPARTEALRRAQEEDGPFFDRLLDLAYYSYYAQPAVIEAVRALGIEYNDTPQPRGYEMDPFVPNNPEMLPAHPRGYYKKTTEVKREALP